MIFSPKYRQPLYTQSLFSIDKTFVSLFPFVFSFNFVSKFTNNLCEFLVLLHSEYHFRHHNFNLFFIFSFVCMGVGVCVCFYLFSHFALFTISLLKMTNIFAFSVTTNRHKHLRY